jgi:hypothetical protein
VNKKVLCKLPVIEIVDICAVYIPAKFQENVFIGGGDGTEMVPRA